MAPASFRRFSRKAWRVAAETLFPARSKGTSEIFFANRALFVFIDNTPFHSTKIEHFFAWRYMPPALVPGYLPVKDNLMPILIDIDRGITPTKIRVQVIEPDRHLDRNYPG
jgi:hypothetical protein